MRIGLNDDNSKLDLKDRRVLRIKPRLLTTGFRWEIDAVNIASGNASTAFH